MSAESVVPGDGSLTLTGFTSAFTDGEVSTVGRVEEIVMTENDDGTVSIEISDVYAVTISFVDLPDTPPVNIGINLVAPDLVMTASGEVGARIYDYSAPRITIEDGEISGGDGPPPIIDLMIGMEEVTASYQIDGTNPENLAYDSTTTIGGIAGALDVTPPPDEEGRLKLTFSMGAIDATGAGQLGNLIELAGNPDAVPSDFDLQGDITYDSASFDLTFEHPTDAFNVFASNRGGQVRSVFSDSEIDYRITTTGSANPFRQPRPAGADRTTRSPARKSRFACRLPQRPSRSRCRRASPSRISPPALRSGRWPIRRRTFRATRSPSSADLSGTVQVLADVMSMDPTTMDGPPGELREMSLNELRISVGGATLTGDGSATFEPGPVPVPVGSVDLQLSGGNALLDTLQGMGIVPIEQLAMVRGLLGAFARPGATPDTPGKHDRVHRRRRHHRQRRAAAVSRPSHRPRPRPIGPGRGFLCLAARPWRH